MKKNNLRKDYLEKGNGKTLVIVDIETDGIEIFREDGIGRITAIGLKTNDVEILFADENEEITLRKFWAYLEKFTDFTLVGFSFDFDLYWIVCKSLQYSIPMTKDIRYKSIDLRKVFNGFGNKKGTLSQFSQLIGYSKKYDDLTGKDAIDLWKNNQIEKLKDYLLQDLRMTFALAIQAQEVGLI